MTVLLADDERLVRSALATLLPLEADVQVVAEAGTGQEAVERHREHRPAVAVLDLDMPDGDGLDAATRILRDDEGAAVLILTRHARPGTLRRALRVGVRGFLGKDADPARIAEAVLELAAGGRVVDPALATRALVDDCPLTPRELDVLRVSAQGHPVRDVAALLHLSPGTVRNYLSSAIQKTHATSRHEAARTARARDWI